MKKICQFVAAACLMSLALPSVAHAQWAGWGYGFSFNQPRTSVTYTLDTSDQGTAVAYVYQTGVSLLVRGARPNTLYTVWVDHQSRATGLLADDYPLADGAIARGVAPAFGLTSPVYNGMRRDLNGFKTDANGNAFWHMRLDYNLLAEGDSPVVSGELDMQGMNRIGGHWLRNFTSDEAVSASPQLVDYRGKPTVPRSTPFGLTVQYHTIDVTHGHTPGVGGADHFGAFKGDFRTW